MSHSESSFPNGKPNPAKGGSSDTTSDPGGGGSRSSRKSEARSSSLTPTEVREKLDNGEYIVERIMGYKQMNKVRYARVKWLGFSETTWEPADQIFLFQPSHKSGRKGREAEYLIGRRTKKGKIEYKVHWLGFPDKCDCWVRESTLNRRDLVEQYLLDHDVQLPVKTLRQRAKRTIDTNNEMPLPLRIVGPTGQSKVGVQSDVADSDMKPNVHVQTDKSPDIKADEVQNVKEEAILPPVLVETPRLAMESKPVSEWSVEDVSDYLTHKGFTDAASKLRDRAIDGKEFLNLLDPIAMRTSLAIPVGPGLKIVKLIRDLQAVKSALA